MKKCESCNKLWDDKMKYCPECGAILVSKKYCPKCNELLEEKWLVCPYCGNNNFDTYEEGLNKSESSSKEIEGKLIIDDDTLIRYQGTEENVIVPDTIKQIGEDAFKFNDNINTVIISDKVHTVGKSSFHGCKNLKHVVIPSSIKEIGEDAFYGCESLVSITLPKKITNIEAYTFMNCIHLSSIEIPEGIKELEDSCFEHSGIETIILPSTLKIIHMFAFRECKKLKRIVYNGTIENWEKIEKEALWKEENKSINIVCINGQIIK